MQYETVIGLEIHVQLATRSKLFSGSANAFSGEPNSRANAIDLGLPGVLPVLNGEAVRMAAMFGIAVGAQVAERCVFARKHYFYPDLPKGYQISQYELPIVTGGHITIDAGEGKTRDIRLTRAHLEEDAGKSVHDTYAGASGIDLNRAGTPLIEVVSEPDLRSPAEAVACMRKVHAIVRYLGICDGNMQEGSFRCDANVSLRPAGSDTLGTRTETKNLNSFRFVERAIAHEVERQRDLLESGAQVAQETRLYDPVRDETRPLRGKEEANDYRYFPDPDLLPVEISAAYLDAIRASLPELPDARRVRFESEFGLKPADAAQLTSSRELADYFEDACRAASGRAAGDADRMEAVRLTTNWTLGEVSAGVNRTARDGGDMSGARVGPSALGALVARIVDGTISGKIAKEVFDTMWNEGGEPDRIIESRGLVQVTDTGELAALVDRAIADNPAQVEQFRAGKHKVLGFFVGQVMKASGGKANPKAINALLMERLSRD